ncbi:cytochrome c3 family protein [Ferrimonas sp. YFM]|uniref:multiheme c-type cytochrome n=1 Tax=Ferrimonas sp. YFM TaxID=3028878 RepID=UPI002572E6B9|nr:cytochrome c3 family protein [Ferrimonas sp. YFM]
MKTFDKSLLAVALSSVLLLTACSDGSDGADGQDGAPGQDGTPGQDYVPVVTSSEVTNLEYIAHTISDGQLTVEFMATDADETLINGLTSASIYVAENVEGVGIQRHPDGSVGGTAVVGSDEPTEGASITALDNGHYEIVAPIASLASDTDAIIRLQIGSYDDAIAASSYVIIDKPENFGSTTTEACYSCHVDYAASDIKHSKYVAYDIEGNVDFVAGCMVCHNNVAGTRDDDNNKVGPGYASNTMQKLGHINHQSFEMDFAVTNCETCHAEPVLNTSISGNGCSDCHGDSNSAVAGIVASTDSEFDVRKMHADASALTERKELRENYYSEISAPYFDDALNWTYTDDDGVEQTMAEGYCVDVKLFDNTGEAPVQVNIAEEYHGYDGHFVAYAGAYINAYDNETDSIVARVISHGSEVYVERDDGTRSVCYAELPGLENYPNAMLTASSRVTLMDSGWEDSDNEYGVSFTLYSEVVDQSFAALGKEFGRRQIIDETACTTCHNNETNYHKSGSYQNGGWDCVACHNNGQDRRAAYSGPAFGPMIHSMHWGIGNELSGNKVDEEGNKVQNAAASLNADNCVSCHSEGVNLDTVPNRYMLSKSWNGGTSGVMSSPILANCHACHDSDAALNHMVQNGGEKNAVTTTGWYDVPTAESCATCHAEGKSFGIDKYHVFER